MRKTPSKGTHRRVDAQDARHMRTAIAEMKKSRSEDSRIHPRVGVVVARGPKVLATAYRGEIDPGEHAEYTALEKKLRTHNVVGATVYTTLEPCTTRNHPKVPCAERLLERGVSRVVIGMLDPNKQISGTGQRKLSSANIATELFPQSLAMEIKSENREFIRDQEKQGMSLGRPAKVQSPRQSSAGKAKPQRQWSTLVVATDAHYRMATDLVNSAKREIVLCQRTSTMLLAPEKGRPNEQAFHNALQNKLREGLQVYHLIHEESCMSDIWRMPDKFRLELGTIPSTQNVCVGRYIGEKPVPRLLIVDQHVLGSVFDIDQTQFYSVVADPAVLQASEHTKRYINDRGQDGFNVQRFFSRLKKVRETAEKILQEFDPADPQVFTQFFASELRKSKCPAPVADYPLSDKTRSIRAHVPLAWPKKKLGVFFDSPMVRKEEAERERIWTHLNATVQMGWRCMFLSRAQLLIGIDEMVPTIQAFVKSAG